MDRIRIIGIYLIYFISTEAYSSYYVTDETSVSGNSEDEPSWISLYPLEDPGAIGDVEDESTAMYIIDVIKDLIGRIQNQKGNMLKVAVCRNEELFDVTVISNDPEHVKDSIVQQCKKYKKYINNIDVRNVKDEGYSVMHSGDFIECIGSEIYLKDMNRINKIISSLSKSINTDWQNVNSVFYSPVRSVGYLSNDHELIKEPCIVVYVDVKFDKGRVPVDSFKIPQFIEGIRTDVREGMTKGLTKLSPSDYHDPVTVGCQIATSCSIDLFGTMGPIIDMGDNKVGFLTSLHNLLHKSDYGKLCKESKDLVGVSYRSVFQPIDKVSTCGTQQVGEIVFLKSDFSNESGYEVAFVELQTRTPNDGGFPSGEFPLFRYTDENPMEYTCGETIDLTNSDIGTSVEKFGGNTRYTAGIYIDTVSTEITFYEDNSCTYNFPGQLRVIGTHTTEFVGKPPPFSGPGDSGSLVLSRDTNGELKAVGIVTGGCSDGVSYVTPMKPICNEMHKKTWSLKKFRNRESNNNIPQPMDTTD